MSRLGRKLYSQGERPVATLRVCGRLYTSASKLPRLWSLMDDHRWGITVISRRAAMRSSRGGCVLNKPLRPPLPNSGFTIQRADVVGVRVVLGIRLL